MHLKTVISQAPLTLACLALCGEKGGHLLLRHRLLVEEQIVRNDVSRVKRIETSVVILLDDQRLDLLDIAENEDADHC